jgi:hypothetical protein
MTKRRPHNAKLTTFESFDELLSAAATKTRRATLDGRPVKLTREEIMYRTLVNKALQGGVRELAFLIKAMSTQSDVAVTCQRERVTVFNGFWAAL